MPEKTKEQRIRAEKLRLQRNYKNLSPARKLIAAGLIERAAFMRIQCEDLEKDLNENGWTSLFAQGDQEPYSRARPEGQAYQTLNGNYQKIIKQLDAMLPEEAALSAAESPGQQLEKFIDGI